MEDAKRHSQDLASAVMQREELELLDCVRSRLLCPGHNKFCHRKSTQGRCARDQSFLLGRNPSLKTRFFSGSSNKRCSMPHGGLLGQDKVYGESPH
jgi:hypothetical protein